MADLRHAGGGRGPAYRPDAFGMWLLLALLLALPATATWRAAVDVERPAPGFSLHSTGYESGTLGDPVPFTLDGYHGRTVVLDLMAVSCLPCREVARDVLLPLWRRHGPDGPVAILSVDTWADPAANPIGGESRQALVGLQREAGLPWRHALDTDGVWHKYAAVTLPRLAVIDPDGRIVFEHQGVPSRARVEAAVAAAQAGTATPVPLPALGLPALALLAGAASMASPCCAGLVPAYLGLLLAPARSARPARRAGAVLWGAASAAAGVLAVYAGLALAMAAAGARLQPILPRLALPIGLLMAVAGAWALTGRGAAWAARLGSRVDGRRGFAAFGVALGLAGFGCTGPLFLPILVAGFAQGTGWGVTLFLLYAGAVAGVLLLLAALVAAGADGPLRALLAHARAAQRAAALLMVAAGLYVAWRAVPAWP